MLVLAKNEVMVLEKFPEKEISHLYQYWHRGMEIQAMSIIFALMRQQMVESCHPLKMTPTQVQACVEVEVYLLMFQLQFVQKVPLAKKGEASLGGKALVCYKLMSLNQEFLERC